MGRNRTETTRSRRGALTAGLAIFALLALAALASAPVAGASDEGDADLAAAGGGAWGYDVSFPQCGQPLPPPGGFAVVGVNGGLSYTANPCLGALFDWALGSHDGDGPPVSLYINTGNPGPVLSSRWPTGQSWPEPCGGGYDTGCSYDYGWNAAGDAFDIAAAAVSAETASTVPWWIDVETANSWNHEDLATNRAAIRGFLDRLAMLAPDQPIGIYSAERAWRIITGAAGVSSPFNDDCRRGAELGCRHASPRPRCCVQLVVHRRPRDLHPVRRHHRPRLPLLIGIALGRSAALATRRSGDRPGGSLAGSAGLRATAALVSAVSR